MADPTGETGRSILRLDLDRLPMLQFRGSRNVALFVSDVGVRGYPAAMWGWLRRLFGQTEPTTIAMPWSQGSDASRSNTSQRSFIAAVVGESFSNEDGTSRQTIIEACRMGDAVRLVPEPDNPHDRNAVAVFTHGGQIGYLRREVAAVLIEQIGHGATASAVIASIEQADVTPLFGVRMEVTLTWTRQASAEQLS